MPRARRTWTSSRRYDARNGDGGRALRVLQLRPEARQGCRVLGPPLKARELNRVPNYLYDRDALLDLSMQGTVNVGSSMTS